MGVPLRATRRELFHWAISLLLTTRAATASGQVRSLDVDRIASLGVAGARTVRTRRYRVRTAVNLFSIPVISRNNVAAACLAVEDLISGTGRTSAIQFACGTWPGQINGFNRFGMTQEVVREEDGTVAESAYMCFMTSSPERNQDQAWRAFADPSRTLKLSLARGVAARTGYQWTFEQLPAPAGVTWMDSPELMDTFRNENPAAPAAAKREGADRAYPTFLHSVRVAMACGSPRSQCTFMHNAKLFDLDSVLSTADGVTLLTGRITEQGTRSPSEFRIWFHPESPADLPFRIEFRPRSFLRLVFEQDPAAGGPILHNLIPREAV
jgi:hypothetical protein